MNLQFELNLGNWISGLAKIIKLYSLLFFILKKDSIVFFNRNVPAVVPPIETKIVVLSNLSFLRTSSFVSCISLTIGPT